MTVNGNNITGVVALGVARQTAQNSLVAGTTTDNVPEGGTNLYFTTARARNVYTVNPPLSYVPATGTLQIPVSTGSVNGYLSYADWNTFNGKANAFTGYTGSVTVITGVNFVAQTTTSQTLTFSNGILTGVV